jgi:hypothetical protein
MRTCASSEGDQWHVGVVDEDVYRLKEICGKLSGQIIAVRKVEDMCVSSTNQIYSCLVINPTYHPRPIVLSSKEELQTISCYRILYIRPIQLC